MLIIEKNKVLKSDLVYIYVNDITKWYNQFSKFMKSLRHFGYPQTSLSIFDTTCGAKLCSNADATAPAYTIHFVRSWNIKCTVKARQIIFASIIPLRSPGAFPDVPVASLDLWPIKLQFTSVFKFRMQLRYWYLCHSKLMLNNLLDRHIRKISSRRNKNYSLRSARW